MLEMWYNGNSRRLGRGRRAKIKGKSLKCSCLNLILSDVAHALISVMLIPRILIATARADAPTLHYKVITLKVCDLVSVGFYGVTASQTNCFILQHWGCLLFSWFL
jgi:hypothetical protein